MEEEILQDNIEEVETVQEENYSLPEETTTEEAKQEDQELTKLIKEYLKNEIEQNEIENTNETDEENNKENIAEDNQETDTIDYSNQLSIITNLLLENQSEISAQTVMLEDYNENNVLQSDINDISLTNILLIVTFITLLFNALLNFSRRIF